MNKRRFPEIIAAILLGFSLSAQAGELPLSDREIAELRGRRGGAMSNNLRKQLKFQGKYYHRKYKNDPHLTFKAKYRRRRNARSLFCEELVNTVGRLLTANLRKAELESFAGKRRLTCVMDRGGYTLNYKADIIKGFIEREECALNFYGLPQCKTVNGQLEDETEISARQLEIMLKILRADGLTVEEVRIGAANGAETESASELLKELELSRHSLIWQQSKGGDMRVRIKFKQIN